MYICLEYDRLAPDKVSEQQACALAAAFRSELEENDSQIHSSVFVSKLARLHETGHENRTPTILQDYGLEACIKTSWVDIGLVDRHPVLRFQEFLETLSNEDKITELLLQGHRPQDYSHFWDQFRQWRPEHPVFSTDPNKLPNSIPILLHADEGTGPKKRGLLVLSWQPVLAKGSRRAEDINLGGCTFLNRMLYSVLRVQCYNKNKNVLYNLIQKWTDDWTEASQLGVSILVRGKRRLVFPVVLGLKGDWQGLVKVGRLTRSFLRNSPTNPDPPGVCHLCRAGQKNYPWHRTDPEAPWLLDPNPLEDSPWRQPSPLLQIPCDARARFYMIDVFHTLHKGVAGDFAASSLDPRHQN